jgi:C_GCAxxG_C_C family probable redox protein
MWEARETENDDMLWAGTSFFSGISRHREGPCGAVSAMAIVLGMMHRCDPGDEDAAGEAREAARARTAELVQEFKDTHGTIICRELLDITSLSDEEIERFFAEKRQGTRCIGFVQHVVEKLYELEGGGNGD